MVSGTTNLPLSVLFFTLCAAGQVVLWKDKPLLGRILACTTVLYVVVLLASHPFGIGAGLVLVRYMIVVVPIALIGVAQAIERVTAGLMPRRPASHPIACAGAGILLAGCLFLAGPLPALQRAPNNFTGHSAFQGSYDPPRWDRSDARHVYPAVSRRADQIPPFYLWLRDQADVAAIVEYPFDVCNNNNLFYFYQHVHGKRVLAGYCSDRSRVGVTVVQGDTAQDKSAKTRLSADAILSRVPADGRISFRNMVDLANRDSVLASQAAIVVLHKVIQTVGFNPDGTVNAVAMHFTSVDGFSSEFRESFGPPVYEDGELVCYRIKHAGEHRTAANLAHTLDETAAHRNLPTPRGLARRVLPQGVELRAIASEPVESEVRRARGERGFAGAGRVVVDLGAQVQQVGTALELDRGSKRRVGVVPEELVDATRRRLKEARDLRIRHRAAVTAEELDPRPVVADEIGSRGPCDHTSSIEEVGSHKGFRRLEVGGVQARSGPRRGVGGA
jgi:hypothetical protein